jgi:endonuclease YncB( thermonuclease family)
LLLAFKKDVTVKTFCHDKYGRTLGDLILPDGRVLNQELVRAGLAWWYEKYSKDMALRALQEEARIAKRGYECTLILSHHGNGGIGWSQV